MRNVVLAVFDRDVVYCERLTEYLRSHLKLSFEIHAFTEGKELLHYLEKSTVSLLVASQKAFEETDKEKIRDGCRNVMILDEEDRAGSDYDVLDTGDVHISKYLPAAAIVDKVLEFCTSEPDSFAGLGISAKAKESRIYGLYTPISRCGQSSFAIKMGELLSARERTILLSFESFSSLTSMFEEESPEDITDLLYYADCEREKFGLYLERIKRSRNGLDFIAPARTAMQLKEISYEKLRDLIRLLSETSGYENIILDLKDYPDGFFDILRMCDVVVTIARNNQADQYRLGRYNKALVENDYEEVCAKTIKTTLPDIKDRMSFDGCVQEILEKSKEVGGLGAQA
jgi:hypothetical protein